MTLSELLWARCEFFKLYPEEPVLTLVTSIKELEECTRFVELTHRYEAVPMFMGMKIEIQPKGWHVRDSKGNTIGKT